jgi:hypothetical protein
MSVMLVMIVLVIITVVGIIVYRLAVGITIKNNIAPGSAISENGALEIDSNANRFPRLIFFKKQRPRLRHSRVPSSTWW